MKKKCFVFVTITILFVGIFTTACDNGRNGKMHKDDKIDYLVLVNKYSKLPDDWEKNVNLVDTKNAWDENIKIEKETFKNYKKLKKALEKEDVHIELDSVYRSVGEQQELWDEWTKEKGIEYVKKYVAVPGYSEHHTGLAVDICIKKDDKLIAENEDMIAEKDIFSKIHERLADYGFILRYLDGKDDITGYAYEPWHLRYVGSEKIAKEIMSGDVTFEEYLGSIKDLNENHAAAKYQIEKALQENFDKVYGKKIAGSRFNVTKIYSADEAKKEPISSLKIGQNDVAFEVEFELLPNERSNVDDIIIVDGEFNENSGWVEELHRVGILKYNSKNDSYSIENYGTGF